MEVLTEPGQSPAPRSAAVTGAEPLDESGTAPGDRRFRPDVEGLRAVAIALVVLYHAGMPGLSGGYVGVDVFFVISGFVITGVLLRERSSTGRTSLAHFYARRSRRILPAATLVILVTVVATYLVLGVIAGNRTAVDSRWAELFLANFHFASAGTNYLNAHQLPSPLQNFWSLAIEEQFYLVYPTLFVVAWRLRTRMPPRVRLLFGLGVVSFVSFLLSVVQTSTSPAVAYFSPFTRAWELALGAMVALATDWLVRIPRHVAAGLTWCGLAAIVFAAIAYGPGTAYPGAPVAVPVVGAALVIAGGAAVPVAGAELLLGTAPFGWLGRLSYSLYLWHWPVLILAAESADKQGLPFDQNLLPLAIAVGASMVTFYFYETPIRHLRALARSGKALGLGAIMVVVALAISSVLLAVNGGAKTSFGGGVFIVGSPAQVASAVRQAPQIRRIPPNLTPALTGGQTDWGGPNGVCFPPAAQTYVPAKCVGGYPKGPKTMVLYGDSHAGMWGGTFGLISGIEGWRFYDLGKGWCPAADLRYQTPPQAGPTDRPFTPCDQFHQWSVDFINRIQPSLVVLTEEFRSKPNGQPYTPAEWQAGVERTIESLHVPRQDVIVLGNIPLMSQNPPQCLEENSNDVQLCSNHIESVESTYNRAEQAAASATGARYIDVLPWFCSTTCTAVIGRFQVYFDAYHVTGEYANYLGSVLRQAIGITPTWKNLPPTTPAHRTAAAGPPAKASTG